MSHDVPQDSSLSARERGARAGEPGEGAVRSSSDSRQQGGAVTFLRRWFPFCLIALEAIALVVVQYLTNIEFLDGAYDFLIKFSIIGLGTILLFLWFVFLAPASPSLRRRVGIVGLVLVLVAVALVRVEGVSGDIRPRFAWRWAPSADAVLPALTGQAAAGTRVDLAQTTPDDYPQFLGPQRTATLAGPKLARDWQAQPPKLLWRQPIGAGWSSFAVVGRYAVTQEQRGDEELVTCYDVDTGKLQWSYSLPVRFDEIVAGVGPRATPTIHEGKVYALGALGHLMCLDGATGKLLWKHALIEETGATAPQWGKSCSPLVHENLVIASAGGPNGKSLVAYDKNDGKLAWSAGDDASSYSSPALLTLCGVPQIVMVNETVTSGHDPADGRMLWQHVFPESGMASPNIAQPIAVGNDRILLSKGYGIGSTLWQISRKDDRFSVEPIWKKNTLKTKMTNAVVRDGYAYGLDEGTLACIEVASGNRQWKRGRYGHGQVLLIDDLLLVQSEQGELALVEASPEAYREHSRANFVDGQSWNYPALSGRKLLVRTQREAACYELPVVSP
jgi:outer membrane protein assembly factor BamB